MIGLGCGLDTEIRNPLHAIVGINACMADMPLTVQQRESVQSIGQSAQLMSAIVNDGTVSIYLLRLLVYHSHVPSLLCVVAPVLDLAKLQAGTLRMTQVPFDLHDLVKELRDIYQISPENRGVNWYSKQLNQLTPTLNCNVKFAIYSVVL
jgi:signal transduction histidine kinase